MTSWVSDDGSVIASASPATLLRVRIEGRTWTLGTATGAGAWWRASSSRGGRETTVVAARTSSGELVVGQAWARPHAEGTEDDPRFGAREWTLTRVIESKNEERT